jgi:hypothetical protein
LASCPQSAAKPRLIKPPAGKASSILINPHQQGHQASSSLIQPPAGKLAAGDDAEIAGADAEIAGADAETGGKGEAEIEVLGSSEEIKGDQGSSAEIRSEVKAAVATGTGTFSSADWSAIPSAEDLADFARGLITLTGPMY